MTTQEGATLHLFAAAEGLPKGLLYRPEFIDATKEESLLRDISALELHEAQYKAYTAKRRIASFGSSYDFDENALHPEPPMPEFLLPLREKVAAWIDIGAN